MNLQRIINARDILNSVIEHWDSSDPPNDPGLPPSEELRFVAPNLWKPESDNTGNLVVLLNGAWPEPDYVEVKKEDGTWERMQYTGRSNPDRHTYRASMPGERYAGRRADGGIILTYGATRLKINIPGRPRNRHGG